jgi:hypothetical protein
MTGPDIYSLPPRHAIDAIPHEARAEWRTKYLFDDGAELRAHALIERAQKAMRDAGSEVTIRTLWIELADRAGVTKDPDTMAAAALAGVRIAGGLGKQARVAALRLALSLEMGRPSLISEEIQPASYKAYW